MPCDRWQYTDKGKLLGINGDVDLDKLMGTKPMSFFTGKNDTGGDNMTDYKKYILSNGTHYISNSGSDENGEYKGGKAGDQNGKEWRLRSWYNRPWTCVLRWPDINVGTLIAQLGIDAALNDKIGYDQGQRYTYQEQLAKVGWLPSKITKACEEDCTAGVNANVHAAGHLLNIPKLLSIPETGVRSGNMRKYYKAAGFKVLTESKYLKSGDYLLPGDILLYDNHHAATNITGGKKVRGDYTYHDVIDHPDEYRPGPKPEPTPEPTPAPTPEPTPTPEYGHVKVTGGRVNIRSAPGVDSRDIGTAHKGDVLPYQGVTKESGGRPWYLVIYKNENGWISSKYSELVE